MKFTVKWTCNKKESYYFYLGPYIKKWIRKWEHACIQESIYSQQIFMAIFWEFGLDSWILAQKYSLFIEKKVNV